jgi:hypothetical protein
MSHCHTCKFAEWNHTPTGRVSRSLPGRCTWTKTVQMPTSGPYCGDAIVLRAGAIWWADKVVCKTFVRGKP